MELVGVVWGGLLQQGPWREKPQDFSLTERRGQRPLSLTLDTG